MIAPASDLDALAELVVAVQRERLVVLTGAGVSLASGIATFRGTDEGAVWSRDVMELGTLAFFERDPVASWAWYLKRFDGARNAAPNPAHHGVQSLAEWHRARGGEFLLVTQNVDLLHEAAGSTDVIKVHGSLDRVRCSAKNCARGAPSGTLPRTDVDFARFLERPSVEAIPRCPACGALLRMHVLWFDELYESHDHYSWRRVRDGLERARLIVFVGTSFSVGVTELALRIARRERIATVSIDPASAPPARTRWLRAKAEEALPALQALLET